MSDAKPQSVSAVVKHLVAIDSNELVSESLRLSARDSARVICSILAALDLPESSSCEEVIDAINQKV